MSNRLDSGEVIGSKPVVCGGCAHHCTTISKECFQLDNSCNWVPFQNLTAERGGAASIANEAGEVAIFSGLGKKGNLLSAEFWSEGLTSSWNNGSIDLPISVWGHCAVSLNKTTSLIIGGRLRRNSSRYSGKTPSREMDLYLTS